VGESETITSVEREEQSLQQVLAQLQASGNMHRQATTKEAREGGKHEIDQNNH
jgi:hypothetical protein